MELCQSIAKGVAHCKSLSSFSYRRRSVGLSARREVGREGGREEGREDCELISMLSNGFICLLGCMMYFTNLETQHSPLTDSFSPSK